MDSRMQRILIVVILALAGIAVWYFFLRGGHKLGDVNGDGKIGAADMQLIKQHILGITILTGSAFTRADVNKDGKVDSADEQLMAQYLNGEITHF